MSNLVLQLTAPYPASSLFFSHRTARVNLRIPLRALYTLHKKWREAAVYPDQHQAVTTLNWWHHELEKIKDGEINHPALIVLKPWLISTTDQDTFLSTLQNLLHGHMHWHHLTRIEDLPQLEPTIDAIAGSFTQAWLHIIDHLSQAGINKIKEHTSYALASGRALWWIDQTRHIGHSLTPSRLWLPMVWLKELNLPVHLILKKDLSVEQRAQHGVNLIKILSEQSTNAAQNYIQEYRALTTSQQKAVKSLHALLKMRLLLLEDIKQQPQEVWQGLISVSPRKKWWTAIWA